MVNNLSILFLPLLLFHNVILSQDKDLCPLTVTINPNTVIAKLNNDTIHLKMTVTNNSDSRLRLCLPIKTLNDRNEPQLLLDWNSDYAFYNSIAGVSLLVYDSLNVLYWNSEMLPRVFRIVTAEDTLTAIFRIIKSLKSIMPCETYIPAEIVFKPMDLDLHKGKYTLRLSFQLDRKICEIIPSFLKMPNLFWGVIYSNAIQIDVQ